MVVIGETLGKRIIEVAVDVLVVAGPDQRLGGHRLDSIGFFLKSRSSSSFFSFF